MLYERWQQVARASSGETALLDAVSGRRWTFKALFDATETGGRGSREPAFPQGSSLEFILAVLRAWRNGQVLCPLEEGQLPPAWPGLPRGCIHLKSTSASSGPPKLIAFTADQLMADVDQIVATMGLRREWPNIAVISLAHSYGFSNLVLPLLLQGVPLILANSPLPEGVRQAASLVPEVTLPGVPVLWRAWLEAEVIPSNVRLGISAGAPLPWPLEKAVLNRFGLKVHNFYGASECGGIAFDAAEGLRSESGCVGTAVRNVTLSLNEEGCLLVTSPAAGLTYWPEPVATLSGGRFQTSDLARISGGQVFLEGRQTDQMNVAGRKISPEAVERALASHPGVRECLVFGAPSPDQDRAEMIVACIAASEGTTAEVLRQHLLRVLPAWQVPRDWWFLPTLATNRRGKLSRFEWRKRYLAEKR